MCFVRCPAPNRSVKEFAVELSLWIPIFIGIPRYCSFNHCVKLRFSIAQCCQALKCRSRFHNVVTDLNHQSRRALPRDGSPAKSLSTKTVTLSTCFCLRSSALLWGVPTKHRAARFNGTESNSRSSLILWSNCFAVSARSNLSWARYESLIQTDLYRVATSFFRIRRRLPSNTSLSCNFSRGVLTALPSPRK